MTELIKIDYNAVHFPVTGNDSSQPRLLVLLEAASLPKS